MNLLRKPSCGARLCLRRQGRLANRRPAAKELAWPTPGRLQMQSSSLNGIRHRRRFGGDARQAVWEWMWEQRTRSGGKAGAARFSPQNTKQAASVWGRGKVLRGEGTLRGWQGRRQDTQLKFPLGGRWFGASAKREESFLTSAGKKDILRKNFGRKPTGKRECFRKLRETNVLKTAPNAKTSRRRAAPQEGSGAPFVFACGGSRRGKISLRGEKRRQCGKSEQLQPSTTAK